MRRRETIGSLVLVCVGFSASATAAQWNLTGTLGQQVMYNDNMQFTPTRKESVFGYQLTPGLSAGLSTKAWNLKFDGQGDIRRYDDTRWDCDSYNFGVTSAYNTERSTFNLGGSYRLACSYLQQLTDTGIQVPTILSENYQVTPSWSWQWTPRTRLIAETGYSKTSFLLSREEGPVQFNFNGNDTYWGRLGGDYTWSRRLSLNGGFFFSDVRFTSPNSSTQRLYGFQLGGNYAISQKWFLSAGAGLRWIDSRAATPIEGEGQSSAIKLGDVANVSLGYADRHSNFSIGYSRAINPSAIGQVQEFNNAFVNYSYKLTEDVALDVAGNFQHSDAIGDSLGGSSLVNNFSRDFLNLSLGLAWEFARNWRLGVSYAYRWQQFEQISTQPTEANVVTFSLMHAWEAIRESR